MAWKPALLVRAKGLDTPWWPVATRLCRLPPDGWQNRGLQDMHERTQSTESVPKL